MQSQHQQPNSASPSGIFLASRRSGPDDWTPVGYLTRERVVPGAPPSGRYLFSYVGAARKNKLPSLAYPLEKTPEWETLYVSDELPPLFSWRVRDESRKDYDEYMSALGLTREEVRENPFTLLARTEGRKTTDWFETFAKPVPKNGRYDIPFFLRGLRRSLKEGRGNDFESALERVRALKPDEELLPTPDPQNSADENAIAIRTRDKALIGHCPRYLARDFRRFLKRDGAPGGNLKIRVQKVNPQSSLSLMLLCRLTCDAAPDFEPCAGPDFEILSPQMREMLAEQGASVGD